MKPRASFRNIAIAGLALLAFAALTDQALADPGSMKISDIGKGQISVEVVEMSLDDVLDRLGQTYGFRVERLGEAQPRDMMSGRFDGRLTAVIARVLQNENHMVLTSAAAASGIARVSIYSSAASVQTAIAAQPQSASSSQSGPQPLSRQIAPPVAAAAPRAAAAQPYATMQSPARPVTANAAQTRSSQTQQRSQPTAVTVTPQQPRRGGTVN